MTRKEIPTINKLEHVQATKRDPNFSILKIDYRKKVNCLILTGSSKTRASKTRASKTHASKTHASKTHASKTQASKTHASKTLSSKTRASKILPLLRLGIL